MATMPDGSDSERHPGYQAGPIRLAFGLQPPDAAVRAWGCRAIFARPWDDRTGAQGVELDLLYDRQSYGTRDPAEVRGQPPALLKWVDGLLKRGGAVERLIDGAGLQPRDATELEVAVWVDADGTRRVFRCSPNASFGYLYCVAFELAPGTGDAESGG
jgi:hypothetical protein